VCVCVCVYLQSVCVCVCVYVCELACDSGLGVQGLEFRVEGLGDLADADTLRLAHIFYFFLKLKKNKPRRHFTASRSVPLITYF